MFAYCAGIHPGPLRSGAHTASAAKTGANAAAVRPIAEIAAARPAGPFFESCGLRPAGAERAVTGDTRAVAARVPARGDTVDSLWQCLAHRRESRRSHRRLSQGSRASSELRRSLVLPVESEDLPV